MERFREFSAHPSFSISEPELDKDLKAFAISLDHLLKVGVYAFDRPTTAIVDVRPEVYSLDREQIDLSGNSQLSDVELVWKRLEEEAKDCIQFGTMFFERLRRIDSDLSSQIMQAHSPPQ